MKALRFVALMSSFILSVYAVVTASRTLYAHAVGATAATLEGGGDLSGISALVKDLGVPIALLVFVLFIIYLLARRAGPAFQTFTTGIQKQSLDMQTAMMDLYRERLESSEKRATGIEERSRIAQEAYLTSQAAQTERLKTMLIEIVKEHKAALTEVTTTHKEEIRELTRPISELVGQTKGLTDVVKDLGREVQVRMKPNS